MPGRIVVALLVAEGFLLLSERFCWFAFNAHNGGTVGASDLSTVLTNFGQVLPTSLDISPYHLDADAIRALGSAGITVVPEPRTCALLAAGAIGLLAHAWRRR
jgi:hypothetical protein